MKIKGWNLLPNKIQRKISKWYMDKKIQEGLRNYLLKRHNNQMIKEKAENNLVRILERFPDKEVYFISDLPFFIKGYINVPFEWFEKMVVKDKVFVFYCESDELLAKSVKRVRQGGGILFSLPIVKPVSKYRYQDDNTMRALRKTLNDSKEYFLSHFDEEDFENICQAINITKNLKGDYVEIGVFVGTSGCLALNYFNEIGLKRRSYFLDTYSGFDYKESKESIDAYFFNTHQVSKEIMEIIGRMFKTKNNNFILVKSNICKDDIPKEIKEISVCNIDVDMYEATRDALNKVYDKIVKNGIIIVEDYGHTPTLAGSNFAVREFLKLSKGKKFIPLYLNSGQIFLIRK